MINLSKNWWKILILSIIATIVDIAGHIIEGTPLPESEPLSFLSRAIGIEATVSIYFIIFFSGLTITFLAIEKWLTGSKIAKGLAYGISWALIMFAGVCEINVVLGTSVIADLRMAIVDAIPLIVLGILLGKYFASENHIKQSRNNFNKIDIIIFLFVTIFYVIGRYFAYYILKIESGQYERPIATFIWTLSMGVTFGILYLLVGRHMAEKNPIKKTIIFGSGIVGINWLIFNLFAPMVFQTSLSDLFLDFLMGRVVVDIIFIMIGIFIGESLLSKFKIKIA